jgi:PAS domain S-box-containing protein
MAAWTNDYHHLMWVKVWPVVVGRFHTYAAIHGPFYWLNVAYGHVVTIAGTLVVAWLCVRRTGALRRQSAVILLAALFPWAANICYFAGLTPLPGFDPTPHAFLITGVLVFWSLARLRFLDILPAAREAVVESMHVGVLVLDDSGRVLDANPAAHRLLSAVAPGVAIQDIIPSGLDISRETASDQPLEIVVPAEGGDRILEVSVSLLPPDPQGARARVLLLRDVTFRRQARQRLQEALQRFEWVVQNAPLVAIQGFDREGRILHWNRASELLYGYSRHEALGQSVLTLVLPEDQREAYRARLQAVWDEGRPSEPQEWEVLTRTGERRMVYSSMFAVCEQGVVVEVFCMQVDVTERRQMEEAERLAAVGQLAAGVAHELNNLLAAMMLRAEMTGEGDSKETAALVDIVLKCTKRGGEICRNLMAFARPRPPQQGPVVLEDAVETALRVAARQLANAQVKVTRIYRSAGCKTVADASQLEQVFLNLILNACHAMASPDIPLDRRQLTIQTDERVDAGAPWFVVTVADTGPGIPPDLLPRIFEPFFTTKRDHGEGAGTGLGLPVSQGIIEAHGGRIQVFSEPAEGTRFEVWLPAVAAPETATPADTLLPLAPPALQGVRVLIAEDDHQVRGLLVELLEHCGAEVTTASDTDQALATLARRRYDLVITDTMMPGGGGGQVLAAATQAPCPVPAIAISGKADPFLEEQLQAQGASAVLRKPFAVADLYRSVEALVHRNPEPDPPDS